MELNTLPTGVSLAESLVGLKTPEPTKGKTPKAAKPVKGEATADVNSPAYELGMADANNETDAIEAFISCAVEAGAVSAKGENGAKVVGNLTAYKQFRLDYTAGRIAAGDDDGYARTRFYRQMKNAGIAAPGGQGKSKTPKVAENIDTSRAAWLACFDSKDWATARKIMARLTADEKA